MLLVCTREVFYSHDPEVSIKWYGKIKACDCSRDAKQTIITNKLKILATVVYENSKSQDNDDVGKIMANNVALENLSAGINHGA